MTVTEAEKTVHAVKQPISKVIVRYDDYQNQVQGITYVVGENGVTRIEACKKNGEYCDIPYIRVWSGGQCLAEFNQHHLAGVFFAKNNPEQEQ
ncbi:hypothetical protein EZH22_24660 [Xanthobacter dioxanivorans]|uniref:Uncharacterized protein n=1 Tax=Xanthobacter dioxanivorans TaxID=2528964 RepID=A0A974SI74_9HYPH|nr:hypothetical protein [Xanthobacter dioxanivorans]QRG06142.1 hypothetical protein EZH22_24660 [Xanthobacter dioxanivorans]